MCLRDSDTVSRIGGDEFMVLLRNVEHESDALLVSEKIRASMAQPFRVAGHTLNISCSIGLALYPQHGNGNLSLSMKADQAMYKAKKRGRNQTVVYQRPSSQPVLNDSAGFASF